MFGQKKQYYSFILLILFSFYIVPKEVYHLFSTHHDAKHVVLTHKGLQLSSHHHHCELLKADQSFSSTTIELPYYILPNSNTYGRECILSKDQSWFIKQFPQDKPLRGPPSLS